MIALGIMCLGCYTGFADDWPGVMAQAKEWWNMTQAADAIALPCVGAVTVGMGCVASGRRPQASDHSHECVPAKISRKSDVKNFSVKPNVGIIGNMWL